MAAGETGVGGCLSFLSIFHPFHPFPFLSHLSLFPLSVCLATNFRPLADATSDTFLVATATCGEVLPAAGEADQAEVVGPATKRARAGAVAAPASSRAKGTGAGAQVDKTVADANAQASVGGQQVAAAAADAGATDATATPQPAAPPPSASPSALFKLKGATAGAQPVRGPRGPPGLPAQLAFVSDLYYTTPSPCTALNNPAATCAGGDSSCSGNWTAVVEATGKASCLAIAAGCANTGRALIGCECADVTAITGGSSAWRVETALGLPPEVCCELEREPERRRGRGWS